MVKKKAKKKAKRRSVVRTILDSHLDDIMACSEEGQTCVWLWGLQTSVTTNERLVRITDLGPRPKGGKR